MHSSTEAPGEEFISTPEAPMMKSGEATVRTHRNPHSIPFLRNMWYCAALSSEVKRGKMRPVTLLCEPILLARKNDGSVFAMRDVCPHRGTPLHHGCFDGEQVQCGYHGWKFADDGRCTHIPSLLPPQDRAVDRIKNRSYPCREYQGNIWVFIGDRTAPELLPEIPKMPGIGDVPPEAACNISYPLGAEHAAYSFFDPSHVAFVHSSPLIHRKSHTMRAKEKVFEPVGLGWCMKRHPVPPENKFYRLFGKNATTEITFLLPGTRIESVQGDKHCAVSMATIAPISENETLIRQSMYWTFPYLKPVKGIIRYLINHFLNEDRAYAFWQKEGMEHEQPFILVGDGDAQIRWFQSLRQAWLCAEAENVPFQNPLKEQTLRFRS